MKHFRFFIFFLFFLLAIPVSAFAVQTVDVSVGITADPNPLYVGQTVTFTITVTNNDNPPADDLIVKVLLPIAVFTFQNATPSQDTTYNSATGDCVWIVNRHRVRPQPL